MATLSGKRVAILATHGFEQSELEVPLQKLRAEGATVDVVSPERNEIKGWDMKDWGRPVKVDRALDEASADDYDASVLPGGQINPDLLRINKNALAFISDFYKANKVIGAVCHAPWLLIETGIAKGREMTGYKSILTDLRNAGAKVHENDQVVTDKGIVSSRNPGDLDAFSQKLIEEIAEGRHQRQAA